jgi:hypothetical protein
MGFKRKIGVETKTISLALFLENISRHRELTFGNKVKLPLSSRPMFPLRLIYTGAGCVAWELSKDCRRYLLL